MDGLEDAIERHRAGERIPHSEVHQRVRQLYTWQNVAERTEKVDYSEISTDNGGGASTIYGATYS